MFIKKENEEGTKSIYIPEASMPVEIPPGVYSAQYSLSGLFYKTIEPSSDDLMDLDSPEYKKVLDYIEEFSREETVQKYKDLGFLYKEGMLIYGKPGTGKTCLLHRVSQKLVQQGARIVHCTDSGYIPGILDDMPEESLLVIVLEEVETLGEHQLLLTLDGGMSRDNVLFLATTNHIDLLSPRLKRPSRLGRKIEVSFPNENARYQYFMFKTKGNQVLSKSLSAKTDGLSVDDLKHVFIMTSIYDTPVEEAVKELRKGQAQ